MANAIFGTAARLLGTALTRGLVLGFALGVAACAQQPRDKVAVGIGTAAYAPPAPAEPYAVLYKPYAMMATVAYVSPPYLNNNSCPSADKLRASGSEDDQAAAQLLDGLAKAGWSCRFGHVGPYGCKPGTPRCVEGLEYHVWRQGRCGPAVISFRGTVGNNIGDWQSNLRWFIAMPLFDQYDQVQEATPDIIDTLYREGCRPPTVIATGHSLGGGLAQHAAYSDRRVDYVYAFDPSPVTGFFSVPFPRRTAATRDLGIDRIYESGEILSLPRRLASGVFPWSQCRPRVRTVRFNTVTSPSLVERHSISKLTQALIELSAGATKTDKGRLGFEHAHRCDYVQPDKWGE